MPTERCNNSNGSEATVWWVRGAIPTWLGPPCGTAAMFRMQPFGGHRLPTRLGYVMTKTIVLLALLGAAGWYYFDRQSKFSDSHILEYVKTSIEAERAMDAQKSCDLLADDAQITYTVALPSNSTRNRYNKAEYCELGREGIAEFQKTPGVDLLPSLSVTNVVFSDDKKRATMDFICSTRLMLKGRKVLAFESTGTMELVIVKRKALLRQGRVEVRAVP